jgi:polyisoprenoid-binding protein YceI
MGRLKWIIVGIIGLAVLGIGGAFIYAAVDEAPPKLALSTTSTTPDDSTDGTSAVASTDISGEWTATTKSVVGYRVQETLAGAHNEAYGRTSDVTGSMTVDGTKISAVDLSVDMTTISSDRTQRDGQFRGRIMETSRFPTATFKLTQPIDFGSVPAAGTQITKKATGQLTLHGVTKTVTFDVKAPGVGSNIVVNGQIPVVFADYNINDPSGGPARTEDHGILEFLVVFSK